MKILRYSYWQGDQILVVSIHCPGAKVRTGVDKDFELVLYWGWEICLYCWTGFRYAQAREVGKPNLTQQANDKLRSLNLNPTT